MFVRNAWYVGAWSDEVAAGGMLARTLLGQPILLWRDELGQAAAMQDRCCHRGLPLSHGCVQGETVRCGYHGLVFDRRGECIEVPGQDRIPAAARVRSFPVVEQDRLLWIWMGEPERADPSTIVRHPWHDAAPETWTKDRYLIRANYQLVTDNLMDLTHVGDVHGRTIGGTPQAHSEAETHTRATDEGVRIERWMLDSVPPPSYVASVDFPTGRVDRWMEIDFFPPSTVRIHTGAVTAGTGAREGRRDGGFGFFGFNTMTPENEGSTHYFWSGVRTHSKGDTRGVRQMRDSLVQTFGEDKIVVEAQQRALDAQPEPLVMIASDAGVVRARRLVEAMLRAERSSPEAAPVAASVPTEKAERS